MLIALEIIPKIVNKIRTKTKRKSASNEQKLTQENKSINKYPFLVTFQYHAFSLLL
jgi:hypothetical protein